MQSERPDTVSRNFHITPENHTDLRAAQHAKPDTRRFASIFPVGVPEVVSVDCCDATHEEHNDDSDDPSRWQLIAMLDNNTSAAQAQVVSVASVDQPATLSDAQQIIACYRAVHGSDHAPECASTEINEELSQLPDDQRSMYTIATSVDTQSTMDMMWRPKPKVHMRRTDQRALIQAQSQAIAMMHNAGLKPTNKIQCRRRGCADILPGVEALKYHIHIHNIADTAAKCNDASPSAACEPSLVQRSTSISKPSKKSHSRSKSTLGTQHKCSTIHFPSRKHSAGSLLPSHLSPRESTPEVQHHVPSLTTVANSFVSDLSQSKSPNPLPVRNNNETSCTRSSTPSRGRRARKESMAGSIGADNPSIAMLLSPPSSPDVHGPLVSTPHMNFSIPLALNPAMDDEDDNHAVIFENAHKFPEKLARLRSPMRALSPTRAMSPIRDGIRRVLSIGYSVDSNE